MPEERLQKIIAAAGVASRRKAEELITEGRVSLNGEVVTTLGTKADAGRDHIRVDGKLLEGAQRPLYLMMYKPKGMVTTASDPEGRPTVMDLVKGISTRVYPVGRLDYMSEGLLLMTNDGELAQTLTHAASHVPKTYLVKVSGPVPEADLEKLRGGVKLPPEPTPSTWEEGERRRSEPVETGPARIELFRDAPNPWYEVTLIEGRNRQIRRMFELVGHRVEKIKRVRYGPLELDVEPGIVRVLRPDEVTKLKRAAKSRDWDFKVGNEFGVKRLVPQRRGPTRPREERGGIAASRGPQLQGGDRPPARRDDAAGKRPFVASRGSRVGGGDSPAARRDDGAGKRPFVASRGTRDQRNDRPPARRDDRPRRDDYAGTRDGKPKSRLDTRQASAGFSRPRRDRDQSAFGEKPRFQDDKRRAQNAGRRDERADYQRPGAKRSFGGPRREGPGGRGERPQFGGRPAKPRVGTEPRSDRQEFSRGPRGDRGERPSGERPQRPANDRGAMRDWARGAGPTGPRSGGKSNQFERGATMDQRARGTSRDKNTRGRGARPDNKRGGRPARPGSAGGRDRNRGPRKDNR